MNLYIASNVIANHDQQEADGRRDTESKVTRILTAAMNFKKLPECQSFSALPGYYSSDNHTSGTDMNNSESPTYGLPSASLVLNAGGRRSVCGQLAKKLYMMPALPPLCTTLSAFKSFQQNRAKLLELAGKFTIPGVVSDIAQKKIRKMTNMESEGRKIMSESDSVTANVDSQGCEETDESKGMDLNGNCKSEPDGDSSRKSGMQKSTRKRRRIFTEQIVKSRRMSHEVLRRAHESHDYQMLRARFISLFTWPSLLSSIQVIDPLSSTAFSQICSTEEYELIENEVAHSDHGNSSDSDSNWKQAYKPRRRPFNTRRTKGRKQPDNRGSGEKGTEDCSSSLEQQASCMNESGDMKKVRKKRKHEEQSSETVQRRASTRIAERVETKRQKKIQMSVMAAAMNCSDTDFVAEDDLLEKRFKVA